MDDSLREADSADEWRQSLALRLSEQRQRSRQRMEAQRQRLGDLEQRLAAEFDAVIETLAREDREAHTKGLAAESREQELARKAEELARREAQWSERERQLADAEQAWRKQESELARRAAELDSRAASLALSASQADEERAKLEAARAACHEEQERLRSAEAELNEQRAELARRQQQLQQRSQDADRKRRQIANQLRARKKELTAEIELHRAEAAASGAGQEVQLQIRLTELQSKLDRVSADLALHQQQRDEAAQRAAELKGQLEARLSEIEHQRLKLEQGQRREVELEASARRASDLAEQLVDLRKQHETSLAEATRRAASLQAEIAEALRQRAEAEQLRAADLAAWEKDRARWEQELATASKQAGPSGEVVAELARLREENKQLEAWLAEAEQKAKGAAGGGPSAQDMEDLRRRFEMAVQDVRDLKTKNADLSEQLAAARRQAPAPQPAGGAGDWESLKKKLLAQLETDFDEDNEKHLADRLTIEGTIKITDEVLARKEEELRELKQLLDSQSQNMGEVAVGAAAIAQVLDTDELIRQERENLQRMQENLREQLRKAEVDISLERAKLARERAELDERLRAIEAAGEGAAGDSATTAAGGKGQKPTRGKWLTRLGLQGKEE